MDGKVYGSCLGIFVALAHPLLAQDHVCADGRITVLGGQGRGAEICAAAELATEQLASCNLQVPEGITIEVTQSIPANCYGLYHCDDGLIQLLPLSAYESYLSANPDAPFGHLSPQVFFDSVLRHELVHAALRATPCPFESCPATQEFVAYTMQIRFLPEQDRALFDERASATEGPVPRERLNAMILSMAPDVFIEQAHRYLSQQDEPCSLIGAIARGDVVLDMPF